MACYRYQVDWYLLGTPAHTHPKSIHLILHQPSYCFARKAQSTELCGLVMMETEEEMAAQKQKPIAGEDVGRRELVKVI